MVKLTIIQLAKALVWIALMILAYRMECGAKPGSDPTWAKTETHGREYITVLQLYFHDVVSGDFPTAIQVVAAPGSTKPFSGFGFITMADEPLTVGPDPSSKLVGRAQGIYGGASREDLGLIMALTFTFLDGVYNGSSLSILGRNLITSPERELPVVGGTGLFRMARGYALARTYSFNLTSQNAVVGYNITVIH